ncbi:MAG: hypothetical protein QOG01_4060 [Pseudonocardiales bacterium]|jgi:hypothetical protein|nr:hypothetical protein [Pseudonocardiales bacterium]
MVREMKIDHLYLRLDGRVFEVLSDESEFAMRMPVEATCFAAKGPDRNGRYKAQIGLLRNGELHQGARRCQVEMDETQWLRFSALVAATHQARDAGPEPW